MNRDAVREYVERSRQLIESSPQMGEENTKVKLIQPLVELLGWNVYSSEVELEYPMQIGQGRTRADYALLVEGAPVLFVEAKGCDSTLADTDRSQLASYMRQKGVDWGLLTNGRQFEVLKRRKNSNRPEEVSLAEFPIDGLSENWSALELLSKDLIQSGEADQIAERIEARRRATRELRSNKEDIADEVAQVIVKRVGEVLIQEIEADSKEFVDELIDALGTDEDVENKEIRTPPETIEAEKYRVTLYNGETPAHTLHEDSQADAMAAAVDYLIEEQGLLEELGSLPFVPGRKNAVINTEPRHPSGEEMRLYRSLSNGCYLFVNLNKDSKMRYMSRFASLCGLDAEFTGGW